MCIINVEVFSNYSKNLISLSRNYDSRANAIGGVYSKIEVGRMYPEIDICIHFYLIITFSKYSKIRDNLLRKKEEFQVALKVSSFVGNLVNVVYNS